MSTNEAATWTTASLRRLGRSYHTSKDSVTGALVLANWLPLALSVTNSYFSVSLSFEVWYDLPSLRKEAVVQVAASFVDNDGTSFQKTVDLRVAP